MTLKDIHMSDTGIQAFDVTPHTQPEAQVSQPEAQVSQPLNGFTTPIPPAPQPQPQPQPQPMQVPASYQSIIDQQNEQIAALMAQNQALNGQITQMVQNGAQFAQQPQQPIQQYQHAQTQQIQQFPNYYEPANPMQQFNPPSLALDQDVSLEGLAEQIGKKG